MEHMVPEKNSLHFQLKEYEKSIYSRPYPLTKVHKEMFKDKVERLVIIGVLERANQPK